MKWNVSRAVGGMVFSLFLGGMMAGCSSTPKVDWNSRIGTYTYNQAVMELGPPASWTKLDDGTVVAEWFLRHRGSSGVSLGVGMGGYSGVGVGVGHTFGASQTSDYLRLTFGPDGKLSQWGSVTR